MVSLRGGREGGQHGFFEGGVGGGHLPPLQTDCPPLESGNLLVKQLDNVGMLACKF